MAFKEIVSPSLTDLFVKELEGMILSGELKAGDRLPTERELADKMKVSLAVVNGGIKRLSERGFLRIASRKGVFVADYLRSGNIDTLEAILEYSSDYYNAEILSALADFRRTFELKVTERACLNHTPETFSHIEEAVLRFHAETNIDRLGELAFDIHHEIAAASGNPVYALIIASFRPIYISSYCTMMSAKTRQKADSFFDELLSCVKSRNSQDVERIVFPSINQWDEKFHATYKDGQKYVQP